MVKGTKSQLVHVLISMDGRRILVFALAPREDEQKEEVKEAEQTEDRAAHRNQPLLIWLEVVVVVWHSRKDTVGVREDDVVPLLRADYNVILDVFAEVLMLDDHAQIRADESELEVHEVGGHAWSKPVVVAATGRRWSIPPRIIDRLRCFFRRYEGITIRDDARTAIDWRLACCASARC